MNHLARQELTISTCIPLNIRYMVHGYFYYMSRESIIFRQDVFLHFILKVKKKHLKDRLVINSFD